MSGLDDVVDVTASAQLGNRLVISGSRLIDDGVPDFKGMTTYAAPALWWSDDGMTWHLAQLPGGYVDRQFSIGTIEGESDQRHGDGGAERLPSPRHVKRFQGHGVGQSRGFELRR